MTFILSLLLIAGLLFIARVLWVQNRRLQQLQEAVQSRQTFLADTTGDLPAWPALTAAINQLITDNLHVNQQSSDQLAQLEVTLGNLREAVLIVDEANYIHLANQALRNVFPATRGLVNLRLELIIRHAGFLEYVRATRAGAAQPRQEFELVDGSVSTWIEVSGAPIPSPDGLSQWALFVIHDMTQQRKLELMRRDFVANASHELRTPLSIIKGYVETLVDSHSTMEPADREKFLRTIQRHSDRLNAIIADLLTLSRLESATPGLDFTILSLQPYLQEMAQETSGRPAAAGHQLALQVDETVGSLQVDVEKLTQVLTNLLDNALKYTPPGSKIALSARALEAGGEVELMVRDTGPGIPAADLPHIFERFYRVEKGRARDKGGTGLGLSIVKHIVQLHGGRVWAESELGQGTSIILRLPRSQQAAAGAQLKLL